MAGALAAAGAVGHLRFVPWAAGVYAAGCLLRSVHASRGWTRLDADHLTARLGFRTIRIPWTHVLRIRVREGLRHRCVQVERPPGRTLTLRAPRGDRFARTDRFDEDLRTLEQFAASHPHGVTVQRRTSRPRWIYPSILVLLLGACVTLDKPWYWVGGTEVTDLPNPCAAMTGSAGEDLDLQGEASAGSPCTFFGLPSTHCAWTGRRNVEAFVLYARGERRGLVSAVGMADRTLAEAVSLVPRYRAAREPVDLGDEAYVLDLDRSTAVVVRQANVVIVVAIDAETGMTTRAPALDITAEALAALSGQR